MKIVRLRGEGDKVKLDIGFERRQVLGIWEGGGRQNAPLVAGSSNE